ncbi:hypothetical protein FE257_004938 [Aspergillus nanangensis]|uniref:Uncharacterized protein n=1 Tax=Aspergillus nanangensis TaxID=2582783 RepID=A0AAD4GN13_ASPNN|nr:hypothetical protein FE257_004938 [Aspergillus nanangensis]
MAGDTIPSSHTNRAVLFAPKQPTHATGVVRPSLRETLELGSAAPPGPNQHFTSGRRLAAGVYLILVTASITVFILAVLLLTMPSVKDAGILQWDRLIPPHKLRRARPAISFSPEFSGVLETVTRAVEPIATAITTQGPKSASQVLNKTESIASTSTDKLLELPNFKTDLPCQISLGTRRLCIHYKTGRSDCRPPPAHLSQNLPDLTPDILRHVTQPLQHVKTSVAKPMTEAVCQVVASGLAVSVVIAVATLFLSRLPSSRLRWSKYIAMGLLSLICLVCFLIPTGIIFTAQSEARKMGDKGEDFIGTVKVGSAGKYALGAVCCAVVLLGCSVSLGGL